MAKSPDDEQRYRNMGKRAISIKVPCNTQANLNYLFIFILDSPDWKIKLFKTSFHK